ncbi:MAG: energy-coupling factor transporter transmembrane component T family protein [Candidatus Thorarchaeota archaeon]
MSIRTFLSHIPPDSVVSRLASPTKIFYPLFFSVAILLVENIYVNFFIVLFVSAILFGVIKPGGSTVKMFTIGWFLLSISMSFFYLVLSDIPGNVIYQIGPFQLFAGVQIGPLLIVDRAAYLLTTMLLRFLALFYVSAILLTTINQGDVIATTEWLRFPWAVSFMLALGFRSMIWFLEDMSTTREALQSRGMDFKKGGPIRRLRNYLSMFIPLVSLSIRRIPVISYAVESRAFEPSFKRSKVKFYAPNLCRIDYATIATCILIGCITLYLKISGQFIMGYPF